MQNNIPIGIDISAVLGNAICEAAVLRAADAMVASGLTKAGYSCLMLGDGVLSKKRKDNRLAYDEAKFPSGIRALTDALLEKGITAGITLSAGATTENGVPGSLDHEFDDAVTVSDWGFSYVAYDVVNLPRRIDPLIVIRRMGAALRAADLNVTYAVYSDYPELHVRARSNGAFVYCRRTYGNAAGIEVPAPETYGYSGEYCRQSLGNVSVDACTDAMAVRRQLIAAASFTAPFLVQCDPTSLSADVLVELKRANILDVLRDSEGRTARVMAEGLWCKFLDGAEYSLAFVNGTDEAQTIPFYAYDFGITWNAGYSFEAEDLISGERVAFDASLEKKLSPGEAVMYRLKLV